jgi:membrane protein
MSLTDRLDRWQRRFPRAGFPIAVVYKFTDDMGNYLAALLTYYAFVSILPLLLLASTLLSVLLVGHPQWQSMLLDSALSEFPVVGKQLKAPAALGGGVGGVVVGTLGAVYGALGVAQALQHAGNTVWHVPRNSRPNPFLARARSLALIGSVGLGLLVIVLGSALMTAVFTDNLFGRIATFTISTAMLTVVFLVAFRIAPAKQVAKRDLLPGAVFAAVLFQSLQSFGYTYVARVIRNASETNAVFALVLGMLAYLYVASMIVVLAMELNVVRTEKLWPRALLTPFTDDVDLTEADRKTYRRQAKAQRLKGFETISVRFGRHPGRADPSEGGEAGEEPNGPTDEQPTSSTPRAQ